MLRALVVVDSWLSSIVMAWAGQSGCTQGKQAAPADGAHHVSYTTAPRRTQVFAAIRVYGDAYRLCPPLLSSNADC